MTETGWKTFFSKSFNDHTPTDEFSHAYKLLKTDLPNIDTFEELLNKHMMLGNIDSDWLLRYYQNDIVLLTQFFEMAKRNPAIKPLFDTLYFAWLGEINITRSFKGRERAQQNITGPQAPVQEGFGATLQKILNKREEENETYQ